MKKSIASALTAAVVLGVASTSFAAPVDDEVAALKARVAELERMIKEQQQQNNNNAQKSEVRNLDSRVSELEEKSSQPSLSDKFDITGELRYRFWNLYKRPDVSQLQLRLFPTFKIDEHFAVKSRLTGSYTMNNDTETNAAVTYAYLESKFDNFQVNAGKLPLFTNVDQGMVADDFFSGIQIIAGDKVKFALNGGHWDSDSDALTDARTYVGAEVTGKFNDKFDAGIGYHYAKIGGTDDKASIIAGGFGFNFAEDWRLFGAVAHNTEADDDETGYNVELNYKGADKKEKSSWGAYAAYRYVPSTVGLAPTYDTFRITDKKGFEVGATWTPYQNTLTKLAYFHGKRFGGGDDRTFFARASIFF